MIYTNLHVNIFNVIRYFSTSICLLPCLESALQNLMEHSGKRHLLGGGIVRWGGHRLGRLSPIPYSYNKKTRLFAMAASLLIHSASILGEIGFGADEVRTYLHISFLTEMPIRNAVEKFDDPFLCDKILQIYLKRLGHEYGLLNEELSSNINSVGSSVTEEDGVNWKLAECTKKGEGFIRYNFSVAKSEFRIYEEKLHLPLESANTTLFVPYHCDKEGYAVMYKPSLNLENATTLITVANQTNVYLRQNKTFNCIAARRFRGAFCFSNSTSTV